MFPNDVTLKVDNPDDCSDFLEKQPTASLKVYYGKSVAIYKVERHQSNLYPSVVTGQPYVSLYCEQ